MFMLHENKKQQNTGSLMQRVAKASLLSLSLLLSACSNISTDHDVSDLRELSLLIPRQSEEALKGRSETISHLQKSQEQLNLIVPSVAQKITDQAEAENLLKDAEAINSNIDLIVKNQKQISRMYDLSLTVSESIPGIKAEYNLMVDMMVRENLPAAQAIIAKKSNICCRTHFTFIFEHF